LSKSGDEPVELNATAGFNYLWSNGSTANTIIATDSNSFWVDIFNNCDTVRNEYIVRYKSCDCNIFIANVFTPNSDGLNDNFFPVIECELNSYDFKIFNRWGLLVFETANPTEFWNGKYQLKQVPDGVYFYLIEYATAFKPKVYHTLKGSVTIYR